ncbi:MAG: guanylate kinase [Verrucomicrobiales bacterium]|nr:guanylate kinase [Verrucomicrobiales bacterium]
MSGPVLLMLSGPSGAGKTTVAKRLLKENAGLRRVVTCTTRAPREGEADGVDYHFLGEEEFVRRVEAGDFLEQAEVYGRRYGTLKKDVLERLAAGGDVLLVNDVQGALAVQELAAGDVRLDEALVSVYIVTETIDELRARLVSRGKDALDVIEERLAVAESEMSEAGHFDHVRVSGSMEEDWQWIQGVYRKSWGDE